KLDSLRREHGSPSDARRIRATVQILGTLAFEDPHLDADRPVGRLGGRDRVIHVGAQRMQRHAPLVVALRARDFSPPRRPAVLTFAGFRSMCTSAIAAWLSLVFRYLRISSSSLRSSGKSRRA